MKKVLFLVSELQRPVGGLHRYSIELFSAWKAALEKGKAKYDFLPISLRDPSVPLSDLRICAEYGDFMEKHPRILVYEGIRGGVKSLFLEHTLSEEEKNRFQGELWVKYRIRSEKTSNWDYYKTLNAYWKALPEFADFLIKQRKEPIALIDSQDWMGFPAGFLARERIKRPLNCRFHSGEYGRSMGRPDFDSPPVLIEAAALQEADYLQGVSVHEAQFEIYNLLPAKQRIRKELSPFRSRKWTDYQLWKEERFEDFLLYEPGSDLEVISDAVAGLTNGIILDSWKSVKKETIDAGRKVLQKALPKKDKYVLYVGRAEYRKGIDPLIRAFRELKDSSKINAGLVISSNLSNEEYGHYFGMISKLGLEHDAIIYNGWLGEDLKKGLFCASDVVALPSLYEPFGLVTLEVFASDMACEQLGQSGPIAVVGDTGGMSEVVKNGANGFKVPMEEDRFDMNPSFLARILKICLQDDSLKSKISKGASERVQQRYFDWNFILQKVFEIYSNAERNYERFEKHDGD
ncbi:MAG: glycosyltransferase family 4 protein [Candidatus Micrarchaeota archaeon]